jgi:hypothetical protein
MFEPAAMLSFDFWRRVDAALRKWGPLLLLAFAILYYGQYYRSDLNLGGEGGTAAVNAMRLNAGWLPIKETTLNYNVMWFYPVAWLFRLTGPDYIAMRIYFFALCLISGLLGFLIVRRVTGLGWYALGVGLLILAIPGMLFRNYMGLLPLLNAWALLHAFVWNGKAGWRRWLWFVGAGLVLGLTFLVRIDAALFFAVIYLGLIALFPLGVRGEFLRRLPVAIGGGLLCVFAAVAVHLPFYLDARARGFAPEFVGQYSTMWNQIRYEVERRLPSKPAARSQARAIPAQPVPSGGWVPVRFQKTPKNWVAQARAQKMAEMNRNGRPRQELRDLFRQASFYSAAFILILHLPILISGLVIVGAGGVLAWTLVRPDAARKEASLVCLVTLGSALTLFPQYFFFRPDTPHLSEFMIPFLVAMACAGFFAVRWTTRDRPWILRALGAGFAVLCLVSEALFFYHSFRKESAGTIAAARKRSFEAVCDNGVHVWLKKGERKRVQAIHDLIVSHSQPDEWVVTFPYSPTVNFMTNRPSYLKNLYVDNASAEKNFAEVMIADFEKFRPAVILIDHRDINDTEFSRFRNWAAPVYRYIQQHYVRVGGDLDLDENEIYVRPDKVPPQA